MPTIQKAAAIGTGSAVLLTTVPAGITHATMNLKFSNTNDADSTVLAYIGTGASPTTVDTIEPGAVVPAKGGLEIACRLVAAGEKIWFTAPAGVVVRCELLLGE